MKLTILIKLNKNQKISYQKLIKIKTINKMTSKNYNLNIKQKLKIYRNKLKRKKKFRT